MSKGRTRVTLAALFASALAGAASCGNTASDNRRVGGQASTDGGASSGDAMLGATGRSGGLVGGSGGSICNSGSGATGDGGGTSDRGGADGAGCAAATLTVTSNLDPPGYTGPDCTLRMAVAAANHATNACGHGTGQGDTIQLGGPNATFVTLDSSLGPLRIASTMTIRGNFDGQHRNYDDAVISGDSGGGQLVKVPMAVTLNLTAR